MAYKFKIKNTKKLKIGQRTEHFSKGHANGKRHMIRYSPLLITIGMQIKIIMGYHFTPLRMSTFKMSKNNQLWLGYRDKGTLVHG